MENVFVWRAAYAPGVPYPVIVYFTHVTPPSPEI